MYYFCEYVNINDSIVLNWRWKGQFESMQICVIFVSIDELSIIILRVEILTIV